MSQFVCLFFKNSENLNSKFVCFLFVCFFETPQIRMSNSYVHPLPYSSDKLDMLREISSLVGITGSNHCWLLSRSEIQIVTNVGYYLGLLAVSYTHLTLPTKA